MFQLIILTMARVVTFEEDVVAIAGGPSTPRGKDTPEERRRRRRDRIRLDLGDDASGHRGSQCMMATAILASDPVQALHVDRVGNADGRFQLGAAGNAAGHGSHFRVIWLLCRHCSESARTSLSLSPDLRHAVEWMLIHSSWLRGRGCGHDHAALPDVPAGAGMG